MWQLFFRTIDDNLGQQLRGWNEVNHDWKSYLKIDIDATEVRKIIRLPNIPDFVVFSINNCWDLVCNIQLNQFI